MVIAGVVIDKEDENKLVAIGVKDSKQLSPRRREELAKQIEETAKDIVILKVPACKITNYKMQKINLNKVEAIKMAEIVEMTNFDKIYIDAPQKTPIKINNESIKPNKFMDLLKSFIKDKEKKNADMIVENYLDESITVVSAASIIAKVERDKSIEELKIKLNFDFGDGYPSHPKTIMFLEKILMERKEPLPYIRWHWDTVVNTATRLFEEGKKLQPWAIEKLLGEKSWQKKIKDFFKRIKQSKEEDNEN